MSHKSKVQPAPRIRITAAALLVTFFVTGCMSAPRTISSPRTYIPIKRPSRVWLTDAEGTPVEVNRPRILPGDTLFGRTRLGEEVWISLNDVQRVQARELDKQKTLMLVGGIVAVGGVFIAIAAGGGRGLNKDDLDRPEMNVITLFRSR